MYSEKELIYKCINNEKRAQRELYDRFAPVLLGICRRYAGSISEAEDILQESFVKIYANIAGFSGTGAFEGWLKRITVNTAITHYHKNKKHQETYDITEVQEIKIKSTGINDADFTKEELLKIIDALPDGYKMIFNLYAIEGYKHREIAEMLKIDINTSKSQYSRARKLIKEKLQELTKND